MSLDIPPPHYLTLTSYLDWDRAGKYDSRCTHQTYLKLFGTGSPFGTSYVARGGKMPDLNVKDGLLYRTPLPISDGVWNELFFAIASNDECKSFLTQFQILHNRFRHPFMMQTLPTMKKILAGGQKEKSFCRVIVQDAFGKEKYFTTLNIMSSQLSRHTQLLMKPRGTQCLYPAMQQTSIFCFFHSLNSEMRTVCKDLGY